MRIVLTVASLLMSLATAEALPLSPLSDAATTADVIPVSGGCGRYAHRGFDGFCRPNGGPFFYGHPYWGYRRYYGPPRFDGYHRPFGFYRHFY